MIKIEDLDRIITIVEKHKLSHFEYEQENSKVVIEIGCPANRKEKENAKIVNAAGADAEEKVNSKEINDVNSETEKKFIKSSLAGTFYLRKNENEEAFVKLHDVVKEDSVVGLVEVMKLFNEVEAGVSGEITDILVKDGEFVEYGQPLFEIKGCDE